MIEVSLEKQVSKSEYPHQIKYCLNVRIDEELNGHRLAERPHYTISPVSEDHVIEALISGIVSMLRTKIQAEVGRALSQEPRKVWSNK